MFVPKFKAIEPKTRTQWPKQIHSHDVVTSSKFLPPHATPPIYLYLYPVQVSRRSVEASRSLSCCRKVVLGGWGHQIACPEIFIEQSEIKLCLACYRLIDGRCNLSPLAACCASYTEVQSSSRRRRSHIDIPWILSTRQKFPALPIPGCCA